MAEMVKLKDEGLIKNIGLSEVDADTLRRANNIHPIHSAEVEYSLLNREIERELISTVKELGIQVAVYGAVGHGVLTEQSDKRRYVQSDDVKGNTVSVQ